VRFATYHDTGKLRGFGHVEFTTLEASKKAIEKTGTVVCGRPIRVDYDTPRAEGGGGGGGRGGFGGTCCFMVPRFCCVHVS
jgi:nucleolin